jgi:gluconate 5-dehydrogenase
MTAEWAADGLQINAIAPGYIHTEMTQNLVDDEAFNAWSSPAPRPGAGDRRSNWPTWFVAYGASFRYTVTCCRLVAV